MKKYSKIFIIVIISSLLVTSSCKKDELIIEGCTDNAAMNYNSTATSNDGSCVYCVYGCIDSTQFNYNPLATCDDGSCIPITYGCTDSTAMNYLFNANSNDGSCIFAYDIALGTWNISSECEDLTISIPLVGDFPVPLNDIFPPTIEITGEGDNVVSMDINGNSVLADVANDGVVTIQDNQTISFDTGFPLIGILDVNITGSGKIESSTNGNLSLTLSFEIPLAGSQSSTCEITFLR